MDEIEKAVRTTGRALKKAKPAHVEAVLAALRAGKRPTHVADWSAFSPAYVRLLARKAGIPPAAQGRKAAGG